MKKLLLAGLMSLSLGMGWCSPAQGAEEYGFLGLFEPPVKGRDYLCRDYQMEHFPLLERKEYGEAAKNFRDKHKNESPSPILLEPDKAAIVYRYKTFMPGFNCEKEVLGVATGLDVEEARKELADRVAKNPKAFRSRPEIVFTWNGGEYKKTIKRNYGGLEITFTAYNTGSGARLTAQGVNTRKDKAAAFVFIIGGKQGKPMTVPPGGKFNYNIGKAELDFFEVYVQYREPEESSKGVIDLGIDLGKEYIKGKVGTKDGRLKGMDDMTTMGVRG